MSLGQAGSRSTVAALLTLLERNDDRDAYIRHAAIMGLVGSASASQLAQNVTNPSSAVRAASVVALRRLKHPSAAVFLNDTDERVQRETVSAIHDDTSIPGALAEVANLLPSNTSHDEAITRRLLSANLRVGKRVNAQHLVDYALNESKSVAMRKEALLCLGDWNRHPFVDRVEGRVRKLSIRNKDLPKRLVAKNLEKLYQTAGSDLLPVLIQLTEKLGIGPDINQLFAIANSTSQSRLARVQAVRSMQAKRPGVIANRLVDLLKTNQPEIQIAVIDKIASSEPEWLGPRLDEKWELLSLRATQHFLHTLGKAASPVGDRILRQSFDALLNGKLTRELELDIITAAKARMTPPLVKLLEKHKATQTPDDTLAPYRPSLIGGDAAMGRLVYEQHVAGQCVRCHDAGGEKNQVGPVLKGIGKRFNREYLLRSLVEPSANIAEGFDVTIAETSDGQTFVGRTQKQTVKTISLVLVDGKLIELKATSIKNLTNTKASAMPPMGAILSPHETRDLVAYLSTL
jgi:putative heme-binding domain-containing protein